MISRRSIELKSAFLLVVFSLNTLVGFACSMGVNMGFNTPHHKDETVKTEIHTHKDGKQHEHHHGSGKKQQHSHNEAADKKDDCCKGKVVKLQIADKNLDHSQTIINQPVLILPGNFYLFPVYDLEKGKAQTYFASQFHPPPRDIRIAIRSFQI